MPSLHDQDDARAIQELRRMAQIYERHGMFEKAEEVLDLLSRMEARMEHESRVVDIDKLRYIGDTETSETGEHTDCQQDSREEA